MIIPLFCLFLGLLVLLYTIPIWVGLIGSVPEGFTKLDLLRYMLGYGLIAVALILGIVGYLGHLNTELLRPTRIVLGLVGLAVLGYQFVEINARP